MAVVPSLVVSHPDLSEFCVDNGRVGISSSTVKRVFERPPSRG